MIKLVLQLKKKAKNSIKMKKIQCQAILRKCPMLLKLLKNLKTKAIRKIQEREKRFAMINKKYQILGKITKR